MTWLLAFEAAARHQNFTSAAEALGTSQPAISQRVAHLESELGVTLFRRLARGVKLTPAGSHLLAAITEGLDLIESTIAETRSDSDNNRLTVATDFGFAAFWLVPRLPSLRLVAPDLNVRVVTSQAATDLHRDAADVSVVFGPGDWPDCIVELLLPEIVLPVCAPSLLSGRSSSSEPCELAQLPLLHLEAAENSRWLNWSSWFEEMGCPSKPGNPGTAINNYHLLIHAALSGQGVALGWRPLVDDMLSSGQLVAAFDRPLRTDRGYYLTYARRRSNSRVVKLFRQWIVEELARSPASMCVDSNSRPSRQSTQANY